MKNHKHFSFKITEQMGKKYSKKSGDFNQIHLNDKVGYNSIFGQKICHGNLVVEKIFKRINFNKLNYRNCTINFYSAFFYKKKISCFCILNKKNNIFNIKIFQEGYLKSTIQFENQINDFGDIKKYRKKSELKKNKDDIFFLLESISQFVGMIYPGKKSLILNIKISKYSYSSQKFENNKLYSYKPKKHIPIINNILFTKKYLFFFQTAERPDINTKNKKIKIKYLKKIKNIQNNCLVIGGSQGLGKEYIEILKKNKKIEIYSTFLRNKCLTKQDINYLKLDIMNINEINNIKNIFLKNYKNMFDLYYFASCKIKFENNLSNEDKKLQKYFFLDYPYFLINSLKNFNFNFFYPSTSNIYENPNSEYSKIKKIAERKLKKICSKYQINFKTFRFPKINSRQTVSLLDPYPKKLVDYINNNNIKIDQIFF